MKHREQSGSVQVVLASDGPWFEPQFEHWLDVILGPSLLSDSVSSINWCLVDRLIED